MTTSFPQNAPLPDISSIKLAWNEAYSVGILEIDNQHKKLLHCFAEIEEAVRQGLGWSGIHYSIVELQNQARFHFDFEEALMRLHGFEDAAGHQESHSHFFKRLQAFEHGALRAKAESTILEFLRDWLLKHVLVADKAYARHILGGAPVVAATSADR